MSAETFVFCPHCGARVEYAPSPRQVVRESGHLRIEFYNAQPSHKCRGGAR